MATVSTAERGEYTMFNLVNFLVWEARQNDKVREDIENPELFPTTNRLVESLTRQGPNRIYFDSQGRMCRILLFSESRYPYQARIETIQLEPDPIILRSEEVVARNAKALEQEIQWWKAQFGMRGDLLVNPTLVLQSRSRDGEFVHVAGIETKRGNLSAVSNLVYCRYNLYLRGPRIIDMGSGEGYKLGDEEFTGLIQPPSEILEYAQPFLKK